VTVRPMKIAMLGTRGFPNVQGGVESHCEQLSTALVRAGCEVVVFSRRPYVEAARKEHQGVRLVPLPAIRHRYLETPLHTLLAVLAAAWCRPDVLHIHAIGPALLTPLAKVLGMRIVVTSHGSNYRHPKWGWIARRVFQLGERAGVTVADELIAVADTIAASIEDRYGVRPWVIPNGVAPPQKGGSAELMHALGLESRRYVLSVGRLAPVKGFEVLIDAFATLRWPGWTLVIVGDADHDDRYRDALQARARAAGRVVLTGRLASTQVAELYDHAGLFVLASYYEGLPIALLEAMSYGLPCVASDIPAHREVGLDPRWLSPPGDVAALAARIRDGVDRPANDAGQPSAVQVLVRHDWDAIAAHTLDVYARACRPRASSPRRDRGERAR
jgi:glycosyltransferase involved in cell wall biosynthesis